MRMTIELQEHQSHWLTTASEREGVTPEATLLGLIDEARRIAFENSMAAVFGIWKHRGIDALEYERELRMDWERDVWTL